MDIRTANHEKDNAPNAGHRHGHPAMRTLALALALAALPAIGAGIDLGTPRSDAGAPQPASVAMPAAQPAPVTRPADATTTHTVAGEAGAMDGTAAAPPVPAVATVADAPVEPAPVAAVAAPSEVLDLEPGEFLWHPEVSPDGPVVVVVSLPEQLAHVYRDGVRIAVSTISSGKPGNDTPTGTYPILQKRVEHYSNLYDNAPMPYMQRLTWDGIALHAGRNPGYPASHGCIRLPHAFAELLYDVTSHGTTVVVADEASHSADVVRPGWKSPVDAYTGLEMPEKHDIAALAQFGARY